MRFLPAAFFAFLFAACSCVASANLSGIWELDLKASPLPDQMLKRLKALWIQRHFAASTTIEVVFRQSHDLLVNVCKLTDAGATLVLTQTLDIEGEQKERVVERIWRKRA